MMVVVGTSPIEQFWMKEIGNAVKPLTDRVSFTWTNNLSFDDLLKHAATLPPHSAIFWELMIVDAAGVVHEGNTALARLHAVSNAPIFSYDESFFGREIVGGPLLAVLDSSRQTAAVAIRILGGEKASDIKIPSVKFSTPKFDWRELQRWGISESRLPLGSEVLFREPDGVGTLPLAADGDIRRPVDSGSDDHLAATRDPTPSKRRAGIAPPAAAGDASQPNGRSRGAVGVLCARAQSAAGVDHAQH